MSPDQNEFKDLHDTNNTSETKGGFEFPLESTEEVQKTTSGIAEMANAVLHDTQVSQDQVNRTKGTLKNLTFTYDERGKEALITPLWPKLEASYENMKDTLEDYGYQEYLPQLPSVETLRTHILNLTPTQLHAISKMGKPTVLVCTPDTLEEKKNKLEGEQQDKTFFNPPVTDEMWSFSPSKITIYVIDGQSEMPRLSEDEKGWEEKYKYLQEEYKKKGCKMISVSQYANFWMERLHAYKQLEKKNTLHAKSSTGVISRVKTWILPMFKKKISKYNLETNQKDAEQELIDREMVTVFGDLFVTEKHALKRGGFPCGSWNRRCHNINFNWYVSEKYKFQSRPSLEVWSE